MLDASGRVVWQDAISGRYPRELAAIGGDGDNLRRLADQTGGRIVTPDEIPSAVRRSYRRDGSFRDRNRPTPRSPPQATKTPDDGHFRSGQGVGFTTPVLGVGTSSLSAAAVIDAAVRHRRIAEYRAGPAYPFTCSDPIGGQIGGQPATRPAPGTRNQAPDVVKHLSG